jgi:putative protease
LIKKPEILAPAGTKEAFIGAINAGANAVYLAGKRFGARAYASNFDDETLIEVIRYAHLRGVLVFIAINTIVFDDEIQDLLAYTDFLVQHDVDALIVQDFGMIDLLTKRYPHVEIHASTQVNAHNIEQVKWLKDMGVKRIVLARETPLEMIKLIKKNVDIELEVFIHGALCVCFSGQCLMSSMIGGRSGNRGECAQPCRMPYALYKNNLRITDQSYLLSTKDLMTIEYLDQLIEAGIDSFKIEGRMRKPEYVIQTVLAYKQGVDAFFEKKKVDLQQAIWNMRKTFNRDFTKGFMLDETPRLINHDFRPNHMGTPLGTVIHYQHGKATIKLTDTLHINDGYRILGDPDYGNAVSRMLTKEGMLLTEAKPGDTIILDVNEKISIGSPVVKTLDIEQESGLAPFLSEFYKVIHLNGKVRAFVDEPLLFEITDGHHVVKVTSDFIITKAIQKALDRTQIIDQMSKLGQTPFVLDSLDIETDDQAFMPVKVMNELRRKAIDLLIEKRISPRKEIKIMSELEPYLIRTDNQISDWTIKAQTVEQYEVAKTLGFQTIYLENIHKVEDETVIPVLKRIQARKQESVTRPSLVHDIGHLKDANTQTIYTDSFFNVTNQYAVHLLFKQGVKRVTLSHELSLERIKKLVETYETRFGYRPVLELEVYGRTDLMITKYCPIAKTFKTQPNCHLCEKNQYALADRTGQKYPLIHDGNCHLRLLHSKLLNTLMYADQLKALHIWQRIHFTTESKEETIAILTKIKENMTQHGILAFQPKTMTYGRFLG